jgi:hypothetical protein
VYDNSKQRSSVLPLVLSTAGSALVGMVVRRLRRDRAVARGAAAPRNGRRSEPAGPRRRTRRGPVL